MKWFSHGEEAGDPKSGEPSGGVCVWHVGMLFSGLVAFQYVRYGMKYGLRLRS